MLSRHLNRLLKPGVSSDSSPCFCPPLVHNKSLSYLPADKLFGHAARISFASFSRDHRPRAIHRHGRLLSTTQVAHTTTSSFRLTRRSRVIRTLDERCLSSSDFHDIGGQKTASFRVVDEDGSFHKTRLYYYHSGDRSLVPFPSDTGGFLYFHRVQNADTDAGEIRFRKTDSGDPAHFNSGEDLRLPYGMPWSIPSYNLQREDIRGFYHQLVRDGFHSLQQPPIARERSGKRLDRRSVVLSRLDQPFSFRYGCSMEFYVMVDDHEVLRGCLTHGRAGQRRKYRGTVHCRFARSNLPEHRRTRTLVLRVLDVNDVRPADPTDEVYFLRPVVGELLPHLRSKINLTHDGSIPWSCNVDKCSKELSLLRLLVDTSDHNK